MTWKIVITLVLAVSVGSSTRSQSQETKATEPPQQSCELSDDDYQVYTAIFQGLGGPEDPEEAWAGKELILTNTTARPSKEMTGNGGWGFRSKSKAAPQKETVADFNTKVRSSCNLKQGFADSHSITVVSAEEIDRFFKDRSSDGWKAFYAKYPKAGGFWSLSRPGYNSSQDESLVYVSHSCGWLCGTGHLYLLAKENGQWQVKNRVMLWIS